MKNALAILAFLLSGAALAQDLDRALMLVAAPDLDGPFRHTALVVMPVGEDRHIGFILNRSSPMRFETAPLYYGGPEMPAAIFAMVRKDPGAPSLHLFGDVYVTGDQASVERIATGSEAARFFAGFVGWESGELAEEIDAGYWYVAEPDAAQVFSRETGEGVWSDLVKRVGRRLQTRLR